MTGAIGQAIPRVDGPAKVTGTARYSGEISLPDLAYAEIIGARIASGRVTAIDTAQAEQAPGVVAVLTHRNMPKVAAVPLLPSLLGGPAPGETFFPMQDDVVHYAGQPVAIVVADTLEQAQHAATLVRVSYAEDAVGDHDRPGPRRCLRAGAAVRRPDAGPDGARQRRGRPGRRRPAGRRAVPVRRQPPQRAGGADHHRRLGR